MKHLLFAATITVVASLATLAACKQGEGSRCQIDSDCDNGLVCNKATNTCQESSGGGIDATVIDAVPMDAAVDAAPDAPDAMPDAP